MRGFARITLIVSMMLAALLAAAPPAVACDFEPPPPPQEALDEATAVFSGDVTSVEPVDDDPSEQYLAVSFAVDRAWKGVDSSPVVVETHQDEGICGFPFEEGASYIVYAHSDGTPLTTALYHRTALLERADEDLDALGEGVSVEAATNEANADEFNTGLLILGAVIISIIAATIMLLQQSKPGMPEDYDNGDDAEEDDSASDR